MILSLQQQLLAPAVSFLSSFLAGSHEVLPGSSTTQTGKLFTPTNYSVVPDIFIQDSTSFNSTGYDILQDSFGLLDKSEGRWRNFSELIATLNRDADAQTTYKVVFIARHGEGFHNVAESKYGTQLWNCLWSQRNTDGELTWGPDSKLTQTGIKQAEAVNAGWKEQLRAGVPLPQSLYSSPLSRSASTLNITWNDILIDLKGLRPTFKEGFREAIGLHTCDKRNTRSYLEKAYPSYVFETPFSEHDELWNPIYSEQGSQQTLRTQQLLNEIFATDPNIYISITAHSGTITSFLRAINHRPVGVQTGGFVPVVIKAVGHRSATNAIIIGGQSGVAPTCVATKAARETVHLAEETGSTRRGAV